MVLNTDQKMFDIMSTLNAGVRNVIVSRQLKDALQKDALAGVRFIPCLTEGGEYDASDYNFGEQAPDERHEFYQVVAGSRLELEADVGHVHITRRCEVCGTVKMFYADALRGTMPMFSGDLSAIGEEASVMQSWDRHVSSNEGPFQFYANSFVVSSTFLAPLISHGFTGLRKIMGKNVFDVVALKRLA